MAGYTKWLIYIRVYTYKLGDKKGIELKLAWDNGSSDVRNEKQ